MAGRKRAAAEDTTEKRETRSSKVAKTEGTKTAGKAAKGTARLKARLIISLTILPYLTVVWLHHSSQTSMAHSTFKSRAVPLHVSITTTAPEGQETASADPGFLTSTTLNASTFSTGSFGWKGHKRMVVELPKAEGEGEGEKVHVTLTINATVIGSKDVKEVEEHEGEKGGTEHTAEEASGEAVESKHGESSPGGEAKESEDNPPAGEEHAEESAS
ncbi:hypothetical protein OG21DRAFT_1481481 [Imleria badia]|nr:hypothetical protein OG21DRAFT_1481481 [Imleria badia]